MKKIINVIPGLVILLVTLVFILLTYYGVIWWVHALISSCLISLILKLVLRKYHTRYLKCKKVHFESKMVHMVVGIVGIGLLFFTFLLYLIFSGKHPVASFDGGTATAVAILIFFGLLGISGVVLLSTFTTLLNFVAFDENGVHRLCYLEYHKTIKWEELAQVGYIITIDNPRDILRESFDFYIYFSKRKHDINPAQSEISWMLTVNPDNLKCLLWGEDDVIIVPDRGEVRQDMHKYIDEDMVINHVIPYYEWSSQQK